jgi:RHS repeat-associated protein
MAILKLGGGGLTFFNNQPSGGGVHLPVDVNGYFVEGGVTVVARHTYLPYGEEATATTQDGERLKFTAHERDLLGTVSSPADDLDYMHARHFSPITGRFLSTDTLRGRPQAPQSWNRYSYVEGGALTHLDPDGLGKVKFVAKVIEFTVDGGRRVLRRLDSREAVAAAQQSGEDLLVSGRSRASELATELGEGRPPIHEVGSGRGQYPHYHPADRRGGHIFYGVVGALTLSHHAEGHGRVAEALAFLGDTVNPLALGQDMLDVFSFFDRGEPALFEGVEVRGYVTPPQVYLYGLDAYGHHTGNFVSIYDLFHSGGLCIDGVCVPPVR